MRACRTIEELRTALAPLRAGTIGLVPTMGALHEGHLSLLRAARAECDTVVMSLFVNPAQFGEAADLNGYPRDEERDLAIAADAGVDLVFAPSEDEMYPPGFQTWVEVEELGAILEGRAPARPFPRGRHRLPEALHRSSAPTSPISGRRTRNRLPCCGG